MLKNEGCHLSTICIYSLSDKTILYFVTLWAYTAIFHTYNILVKFARAVDRYPIVYISFYMPLYVIVSGDHDL